MHSRPSWDPIHYVLLFSYGTDGFHLDIPKDGKVKAMDILPLVTDAARQLGLNIMLYGDRLFQQYVVDSCVKMEQQRLNYLQFNQNSLELTLSGE